MLEEFSERLLKITEDCRDDMHEPDNNGITAMVTGDKLDNAMGDDPIHNQWELIVNISKISDINYESTESFNLASLIALARIGAKQIVNEFND